ncbi:NADP-dependent oxidoreductase [Salmonirosea aquatica]|uniref:Zinc-binding dehydrogenase n=1 Tax=Salmonirosea aquatica TaxID=2654236 RepID=A0A7C9FPL3_9BACT|nr:zinc-binding dehydrogenase [Cytophagaceae bacterium SJW1-29]
MKSQAIQIKEKGTLDNLELVTLEVPTLESHDILVKVKAAGVNPVDFKGVLNGIFKMPYTVGSDIAGIVEQVGAEVKNFEVGQEVIGSLEWAKQGAYAEYVVTEERYLARKPDNLSFTEAAAVPLVALTAWQALFDHLNIQAGEKVLIQAAAGGVGTMAVQLAKWKGAYVVALASPKNASFLTELGADEVVDYKRDDLTETIQDVDAAFDSMATSAQLFKMLKKGGRYVSITAKPSQELAESYGVSATNFLFHSDAAQLSQLVALIEEGKIKVFLDKTFPLAEAKAALEYQKQGHSRGKNVLLVD